MHREAIGRHNIEAYSGKKHDAPRPGFGISGSKSFKDGDFTGQVQIMSAGPQTSFRHLSGRVLERTGAVQNHGYGFKRTVHGCGIIETENPVLDTQFSRLAFEFGRIAPRENWPQAGLYRQASSRITDKTSGPIQKEIRCHAILPSCSLTLNASLRNGHGLKPDFLPLWKLTCDERLKNA